MHLAREVAEMVTRRMDRVRVALEHLVTQGVQKESLGKAKSAAPEHEMGSPRTQNGIS